MTPITNAKHAVLEIIALDIPLPRSRQPPLSLSVADDAGQPEAEVLRVTEEAARGSILLAKASTAQRQLIDRLARSLENDRIRFKHVSTLQHFLTATRTLDAAALGDRALARLWREAEAATASSTVS
jgi:hypothetical protein